MMNRPNVPLDSTEYANRGLSISQAFVDHVKRFPDKTNRPSYIYWNEQKIQTVDKISVRSRGRIRGQFIQQNFHAEQGFDLSVAGYFELQDGQRVKTLRTWNDSRYESVVEYPFFSEDGLISVWNVYKRLDVSGRLVEEKLTQNAAFWIEELDKSERIYHCSQGLSSPPNFEDLVFRITLLQP